MTLREYSQLNKVSIKKISRDTHINEMTLYYIYTGKHLPSMKTLRVLWDYSKGTISPMDYLLAKELI
jgi:hypothetical protein